MDSQITMVFAYNTDEGKAAGLYGLGRKLDQLTRLPHELRCPLL